MKRPSNRRQFMTRAALAAGAAFAGRAAPGVQAAEKAAPFSMKFAPHEGHFKNLAGDNVLDQIRFVASQGFRAWEDNRMGMRPVEEQVQMAKTLEECGMEMGVFSAFSDFERPVFAVKNDAWQEEVLTRMRGAVEIAKRVNTKFMTVVPGTVDQQFKDAEKWNSYGGPRIAEGYQTANVIELLRRCVEIFEPHGLTMVLEPLNWYANHGGLFLRHADQAYAICKAVQSPSCKILFDIYHMQIDGGNLIPNIDQCWDEIGYFQSGDNPGRKEPGTGEIHYANVFRHIASKSRDVIIGIKVRLGRHASGIDPV